MHEAYLIHLVLKQINGLFQETGRLNTPEHNFPPHIQKNRLTGELVTPHLFLILPELEKSELHYPYPTYSSYNMDLFHHWINKKLL